MPVFAVRYTYSDDLAAREQHRAEHRAYLGELADRGVVLASGPFAADEDAGALVLVRVAGREEAAALADADPFRVTGVITAYSVTGWEPIIGRWAADLG